MLTLQETKDFLRLDGDDEDALVSSLIITAKELIEETLRYKLTEFEEIPETVHQAMLIVVGTLYEERQVAKDNKSGVDIKETLDLVRRMLFAYRKGAFLMNIGKLNRRVEILQFFKDRDEYGGEIGEWKTVAKVWAAISPVSGTEQMFAQQVTAEAVVKITIRYLPWLDVMHRIMYGGKLYEIVGTMDADTAHTQTILNCKEMVSNELQRKAAESENDDRGRKCDCKRP